MLRFVEVDIKNWRIPLKVREEQVKDVAGKTEILARAFAYRNQRSRAFFIYKGDIPVGMGLYYDEPEIQSYVLSQLLIDERYQNHGFGTTAVEMILKEMKNDGKYKKATLCYMEGNLWAKRLYENFGFRYKETEEDEVIMELEWK